MTIRDHIEDKSERWGRLVVAHPWTAIVAMLGLTIALSSQLPHLVIDHSLESFIHEDDPTLIRYNEFRDEFGRDDISIIAIEPEAVFDLAFFEKLRALHRDLEAEVPYTEEVESLINARWTRGEGDTLVVEDLLEEWPQSQAEARALRARVFANPLYVDTLVSRDGRFTSVLIEPYAYSALESHAGRTGAGTNGGSADAIMTGVGESATEQRSLQEPAYLTYEEHKEHLAAIREVIARHQAPGFEMYLAGTAVVEERLNEQSQRDFGTLLGVSMVIIVIILYVVFRRALGVILPLTTVMLSLASTLGIMVLLGIPLTLTTEILPPFLLTVGVCDSVHILVIFFQRLRAGTAKGEAIVYALGHSGLAVLMTSLTTAAGLLSFVWAEVAPVSHLGMVAPIGVVLAMVYTVVLLPALLTVVPLRLVSAPQERRHARLVGLVVSFGVLSSRWPRATVTAWAAVVVVAVVGLAQLRFAEDGLRWFPQDDPVQVASRLVDRAFDGSMVLEAIISTGSENGLYSPELLRRLDGIHVANESIRSGDLHVGKTISIVDVVKETHRALNANSAEFYVIPDDRQLVAQELLLFEMSGSDDLEDVVDWKFSKARVTMKLPWTDWMLYSEFLETLERNIETALGDSAEVTLTGLSAVLARAASTVNVTMARSYTMALVIITPLMMFMLGSVRRGLLSMVPNLVPIVLMLGLMGWADIPVGLTTLVIGGVVIGLAVDDTIHFMHGFNRNYVRSGDAHDAVRETLETTGMAMLFTSVVLTAGFLIFTIAYMRNVATFGMLCSVATSVAFLTDMSLAPALMVLVTERERQPAIEAGPSLAAPSMARPSLAGPSPVAEDQACESETSTLVPRGPWLGAP